MAMETIYTHDAISLFHEFMQLSSEKRVMHLIGDAKMGKSHLLTRIFPTLAVRDHQAQYAILDLRNGMHRIPDILHYACASLGESHFDRYKAAYHEWTLKPKVNIQGMKAFASSVHIDAKDTVEDRQARDLELTNQFVQDLSCLNNTLVLFLVDSFNNAKEAIQVWLLNKLVALISQYAHVRVIIVGRTLPEAPGSYASRCQTVRLTAIKDIEEYVNFCKKINATLVEQSIRDLAHATDYTPGLFAEYAYKFTKLRT